MDQIQNSESIILMQFHLQIQIIIQQNQLL